MTKLLLLLYMLTGMCALVYQLLWTRWLGLLLGNFATATATVVATFMAGLGLGYALMGRVVVLRHPRTALQLYALLEAGLAGLAALSPFLFSASSTLYLAIAQSFDLAYVRALVCAVLLLPPTILMGATLPALVQTLSAISPRTLGPLYALNTFGGALGPLLAAFVMLPHLGLKLTLWLTCALNVACAATAFWLARRWPALSPLTLPSPPQSGGEGKGEGESPPPTLSPSGGEGEGEGDLLPGRALPAWLPYALGGISGFLALAFEVALTRLTVLTITGGSVYGFALILSAFLTGLALGAYLLKHARLKSPDQVLLIFAAAFGVIWLFSLATPFWDRLPPLLAQFWSRPTSFGTLSLFNSLVVFVLLLTVATAFGFSLPLLAATLRTRSSKTIGQLFAANTLGGVLGALLTGFVLLRVLGLNFTLLALGETALLIALGAVLLARPTYKSTPC